MGLETKDKKIGDTTYRLTQLPNGLARPFVVKLFKIAGPALAHATTDKIDAALASLATNLNEEDVESAVDLLFGGDRCSYSTGNNKWPVMTKEIADIHFAGKTHELFKLLGFFIEVNFGGFLDEYKSARKRAAAARAKATDSTP